MSSSQTDLTPTAGDQPTSLTAGLPHSRFGLTLTLTTACNLRCSYCYIDKKAPATLSEAWGRKAIDRSLNSLLPAGKLELGFFGGEALLQPQLLAALAAYARERTAERGLPLSMQVTTNGTIDSPAAWDIMLAGDIQIAISCDGIGHDRHRRREGGRGTLAEVLATVDRLAAAGKDFSVVSVVRPDTLESLPQSLELLLERKVPFASPSLDLWATWSPADLDALERTLAPCADLWRRAHGRMGIGWFDTMAGRMADLKREECSRCAFGAGQVAVSASGRLFPCERLIADDADDTPQRLPGHVSDGDDFLTFSPQPARALKACTTCTIADFCSTICRCSNFVRTSDVSRPDGLLCRLNQAVFREVSRVLELDKAEPEPEEGI